MNFIAKFFHELRNPHCSHCREAELESKVCQSCETLKTQIEILRYENQQLLETVTRVPVVEPTIDTSNLKPIMPRNIPWGVRKQMLEKEDAHTARLLREKAATSRSPLSVMSTSGQTVADLEKELGVEDAQPIASEV